MERIEISESEIIELLKDAYLANDGSDDGAMSRADIADRLGWGEQKTRRYLRKLKSRGDITVRTVWREAVDDVMRPVPGYLIKGAP